jgi:segregation and condensation protein B
VRNEAILEGLLFVAGDEGISKDEAKDILEIDNIDEVVENLKNSYKDRGIDLTCLGNRLKLVTKNELKDYIEKMVTIEDDGVLSEAALETLAIIAYNQPVTRVMVDDIRGINSSHMIRKLVYKNLICEVGRSESAGRPILYGTTPLFLDYFGINNISELPQVEVEHDDTVKDLYESKYNEE